MPKECKLEKEPKHIPYGSKRNKRPNNWCPICDAHHVNDVNKKTERQKSKQEIKKEIENE